MNAPDPEAVLTAIQAALCRSDRLLLSYAPGDKIPYEVDLSRYGEARTARAWGSSLLGTLADAYGQRLSLDGQGTPDLLKPEPTAPPADPETIVTGLHHTLDRCAYLEISYHPGGGEFTYEVVLTRNDQITAPGEGPTLQGALTRAHERLLELQATWPDFPKA